MTNIEKDIEAIKGQDKTTDILIKEVKEKLINLLQK